MDRIFLTVETVFFGAAIEGAGIVLVGHKFSPPYIFQGRFDI
jgi:hypothetical protein